MPGVPGQSWLEQEDIEQNTEFDVRAPCTCTYGHVLGALESPDEGGDILFQEGMRGFMESAIVKNPKILGGTPVFRGTRVPLQLLFDSRERGHTLEEFLAGYPTVSRELAIAALEEAQQLLWAKA